MIIDFDEESISLKNNDNFKQKLDINNINIFKTYANIITLYLKNFYNNIITENIHYKEFIMIRGIDTIANIFRIVLYYTKDINFVYFYCKQSYLLYIQYIFQLNNINSATTNYSKNAIEYIYKKSIFNIDNNFKQNIHSVSLEEKQNFNIINNHITSLNIILSKIIYNDINDVDIIFEQTITYFNNINLIEADYNVINICLNNNKNLNNSKYCEIMSLIFKKIYKNKNNIIKLKQKIFHNDYDSKLCLLPSNKFVKWLL
jgi:hypothetical protein